MCFFQAQSLVRVPNAVAHVAKDSRAPPLRGRAGLCVRPAYVPWTEEGELWFACQVHAIFGRWHFST